MSLYKYYQLVGGNEKWVLAKADADLTDVKPTFVTILNLDTLGTIKEDEPTAELLANVKYFGPMYFDLDSKVISESIEDAKELAAKLEAEGLTASDLDIYLSGKKGLHIIVAPECFMEKLQPVQYLPAIYKEVAFKLATDTMDFAVYTARSGRMLRTCHNIRENGNYRVSITLDELKALTPESYSDYCKAPRPRHVPKPSYRAGFSLIYDAAKQKVSRSSHKKPKPVDAKTVALHLPIVQQVMRGEVIAGAGFNKIAIQLAIYARDSGMTSDQLVAACEGLLNRHAGDGDRYNTPSRRECEIRRMCDYVDGNAGYSYAIGPMKALLARAGGAPAETIYDDEGNEMAMPTPLAEAFSCGVTEMGGQFTVSKGDAGDTAITNFIFDSAAKLITLETEEIVGIKVVLNVMGRLTAPLIMSTQQFTGSSGLQNAIAAHGAAFTGSDIHARGILQIMLHKATDTRYIIDSEGVNLVKIPLSQHERLRDPFVVWADSAGVRTPAWVDELGVKFDFSGFPDAKGVIKTDLTVSPTLEDLAVESEEHRQFALTTLKAVLNFQDYETVGKLVGWMVAAFWRQQFHAVQGEFPLLHVYGPAGLGKTAMTATLLKMFYYRADVQALTPESTTFAFMNLVAGSGSIPVLLDEYKPGSLAVEKREQFRSIFRSAFNMKDSIRGGGNRSKASFNALNKVSMSGPIVFIAEAPETETAIRERSVTVAIKKASPGKHTENLYNFQVAKQGEAVLSAIGHSLATQSVADEDMSQFRTLFLRLHTKALKQFMIQSEHVAMVKAGTMTNEEFRALPNFAPRAIFACTVVMFGLIKLRGLFKDVFPEEYDSMFADDFVNMQANVFKSMGAQASSMVPEYVKLLTTMSDMTLLAQEDRLRLVDGLEYNLSEIGGMPVLAIAPRAAYSKYRMHCKQSGSEFYYSNDLSFTEALMQIPQFLRTGKGTTRSAVDTLIFNFEELQRAGVPKWAGKSAPLR